MTLRLPPAEPPHPDVDDVLELLRVAKVELGHADARWARVIRWARDPMNSNVDRMKFRIQQSANRYTVELWRAEVTSLEARARQMGARL